MNGAPALVPLGALVGAGEFAVCGLLCTVAASLVRREPVGEPNWMQVVRADAVRPFQKLARRLPWPAVLAVFLAVGLAGEAVLRAGAFALAGSGHLPLAVGVSLALTLAVCAGPVRGTEAKTLAAVVGTVTGVVHALLYASGHSIVPLAVADAVFLVLVTV